MDDRISEALVVTVDVACLEPACRCEKATQAIALQSGRYGAPTLDVTCAECSHETVRHHVLGPTPSQYERKQIVSNQADIAADSVTIVCSSCSCMRP